MSKADELLRNAMTRLRLAIIETDSERHELMDEIYDYLNRKDKLVVGSEWVCDVLCYGTEYPWFEGHIVTVKEIYDNNLIFQSRGDADVMFINQFLVCFSPKESI